MGISQAGQMDAGNFYLMLGELFRYKVEVQRSGGLGRCGPGLSLIVMVRDVKGFNGERVLWQG